MISKILVAIDGSEHADRALKAAIELARRLDASLLLVNVLEDFGNAAKAWKKHDPVVKELEKEHDALLKKYQAMADKQAPAKVEIVRAEGNAAEQIIKIAEKKGADLIVIGRRGLGGTRALVFGSVSHKVIDHSSLPVLTVK